MQRLVKLFTSKIFLESQTERFKFLIYLYLFLRCCFWIHQYDLLFGSDCLIYSSYKGMGNFKDIVFILLNSHSTSISYCFLIGVMLLCLINLLFRRYRLIADILIWLMVVNLHYKAYSTLTGGDFLVNQLLFFNIFLLFPEKIFSENFQFTSKMLHNGALIAVIVQICLVYFLSGLAKLIDTDWQGGNALIIIAQIEQFKMIVSPHEHNFGKVVFIFLNYTVLAYQLLFPILVFIKKTKKTVLSIGVLMHLYIILFMGLLWFGLIMIITYVFFWPLENPKE